jgi:hypothetical protein
MQTNARQVLVARISDWDRAFQGGNEIVSWLHRERLPIIECNDVPPGQLWIVGKNYKRAHSLPAAREAV